MQEKQPKNRGNTHMAYKDIFYQTISLQKNKISGCLPKKIYTDFSYDHV